MLTRFYDLARRQVVKLGGRIAPQRRPEGYRAPSPDAVLQHLMLQMEAVLTKKEG